MEDKVPSRLLLLKQSYQKMMDEIFKSCSPQNIQSIASLIKSDLLTQKNARFISTNFIRTVSSNSKDEFEDILNEKNIPLLLDNIDNNIKKNALSSLENSAYNFMHIDPHEEARKIILFVQQIEIQFLRQYLANLKEKTENEKKKKEENEEKLQFLSNQFHEDLTFLQDVSQ